MLTTAEVRWFGSGEVPGDVLQWFFGALGDAGVQRFPPRTDRYVRMFAGGRVAAKLREGKFEIKVKRRDLKDLIVESNVTGKAQEWSKLGFPLPIAGSNVPSRLCLPVWKERALRRYTECGSANLELTRILIGDQAWWTVNIEAAGANRISSAETLDACARSVLAAYGGSHLTSSHSYAYPDWLAALSQRSKR